ncbi:MAG: helix-turn-helix domain-containing protein [Tissierellia bacterium]|nr:helix-turn-helix domain-containing protein [Tissierellia bacterium]
MKELVKYSNWDEAPDILYVPECASLLKIGINQMYKIARTNNFPVLHFGKQLRVPKEALKRWVQDQTMPN